MVKINSSVWLLTITICVLLDEKLDSSSVIFFDFCIDIVSFTQLINAVA